MFKEKGKLALFSAAVLYGFFGVFSKLINFQIPLFYQSWVRNIFSILIIGIIVLFTRKWKTIKRKDHLFLFLRSLCGFISFVGLFVAFTKLEIGTTYFLSYAAAIMVGYLLGIFVFHEKVTKQTILSFLLAVIGLFFVYKITFRPDKELYIFLALISGATYPGWSAFSKKISSTYSNMQLNFIDSFYACLFPFLSSLFLREKWVPINISHVWVYTFLFAVLFLVTGLLIVYGFRTVSAQAGSVILLFEIIAGIVFGFIFFRQTLPISEFLGGVLIIFSILLQSL